MTEDMWRTVNLLEYFQDLKLSEADFSRKQLHSTLFIPVFAVYSSIFLCLGFYQP